jgi:microcystin-dependent protein
MAEPFLSEIRLMSFAFAPKGWALCNGQMLPINQNQALFSLLGTRYGGNGQTTFALPDLRGRVPIHQGRGHTLGESGGEEAHTLTASEAPPHRHRVRAGAQVTGGTAAPAGAYLGGFDNGYRAGSPDTELHASTVTSAGGGQPHTNLAPYLGLSFCIALTGIYPSQT